MTTLVIGLTGTAKSGKNTCADIVQQAVGNYNDTAVEDVTGMYPVAREMFAGPLKTMIAVLLDFYGLGSIMDKASLEPFIEGDKKEEVIESIGVSPRVLMQTLGTDWGRNMIKDSLWVDAMSTRLKGYDEATKMGYAGVVVLVTDVRFDNEAKAIKDAGGIIVKVQRGLEGVVPDHASEAGVSKEFIDAVIENSGTLEDLQASTLAVLEPYLPFLSVRVPEEATPEQGVN